VVEVYTLDNEVAKDTLVETDVATVVTVACKPMVLTTVVPLVTIKVVVVPAAVVVTVVTPVDVPDAVRYDEQNEDAALALAVNDLNKLSLTQTIDVPLTALLESGAMVLVGRGVIVE